MTTSDNQKLTATSPVPTADAANDNSPFEVVVDNNPQSQTDNVSVSGDSVETALTPEERFDIRAGAEMLERGIDPALIDRQRAREIEGVDLGTKKFERWCEQQLKAGNVDSTPGGKELARRMLGPICEAIIRYQAGEAGLLDEVFEQAQKARRGRQPGGQLRHMIEGLDPLAVANITLQAILQAGFVGGTYSHATSKVSEDLERYARFRALWKESRLLAKNNQKQAAARAEPQWKADKRIDTSLENVGLTVERWNRADAMKLGSQLCRLIMERTGIARTVTRNVKGGRRSVTEVEIAEEWVEKFDQAQARAGLLHAHVEPSLVPPRNWSSPVEGIFWSYSVRSFTILGRDFSRARLDKLFEHHRNGQLDTVYAALNTIQATPFRVNRKVLDVLQYLSDEGTCVGGDMVVLEPQDLPVKPKQDAGEEVWKSWSQRAAQIHSANRQSLSKRVAMQTALDLAHKLAREEEFYYGWHCDFRGRMYPVQSGLTPQGTELEKALLEFANAVPITDEGGEMWLAIHGANSWGEDTPYGKADKLPFDLRHKWVLENTKKIVACAEDPIATTWWRQAGDPWLFLAFCFEWAAYREHGYGYESRLPVSIDGTCNGLQHLSAMTRDYEGAKAVNLVPADRPEDIYGDVAERTMAKLRNSVQDGTEFARGAGDMLEFGITRKETKRTVMTIPYGLSQHSANDYIRSALEERAEKTGQQAPWRTKDGDLDHDRIRETRGHCEITIWQAVTETIGAAMSAMAWIQECCNVVTKETGQDFEWTSASGWPVLQRYRKTKEMRIESDRRGSGAGRDRMVLQLETKEISPKDHKNGSAPNVVHSFDAAHMVSTINRSRAAGVNDFFMIHDSFGCHAQAMPVLHENTRHAFADLYRRNILQGLKIQWEQLAGVELPEPPVVGTFDVEQVRKSLMFFS